MSSSSSRGGGFTGGVAPFGAVGWLARTFGGDDGFDPTMAE
jgi:hypothetical protein